MARRAPSGRALAAAPAPSRRLARRVLVLFALSLSCSYLCYSLLCCCGGSAAPRARCPSVRAAAAKKLLQQSRPCGRPPPAEPPAPPAGSAPGVARPGTKRLPRAIVVGVKKGGTRAVLEFIRVHPDVRALGTEPHFFDRNYHRGLEWYSAEWVTARSLRSERLQPTEAQPCRSALRSLDEYRFSIPSEETLTWVKGHPKHT